jgi:hypothetical protein
VNRINFSSQIQDQSLSHLSLPGVINQQASPQVVLLDRQVAKVSDANLQQSLSVDGVINKDLKLSDVTKVIEDYFPAPKVLNPAEESRLRQEAI